MAGKIVESDTEASGTPPPVAIPSRPWDWSFQTRLILGVSSLVLLTGGLVTWLAYRGARASTEMMTRSLFGEVSRHAVTHTRAFVLRAAPLVESLAQLRDQSLALGESDALARQLLVLLERNPGLSWVSFGDEQGTFTGAYRTPENTLRINQSRIVAGKSSLIEHDVLPDGSWKKSRQEPDSRYDPRTRPFYQKARLEKRLVWLPPYVFFNQGIPGISCAAPVLDSKGQMRGVLSIDFDLNALSDFVAGLRPSEGATVFLFTRDQVLLAHPNHRRLAAHPQNRGNLLTLADTGDTRVDAFRAGWEAGGGESSADNGFQYFSFAHDGKEYLASATAFRVGDDLDWVVGAMAPREDFLAGVWRSQALALGVAGAALLVGVLLAALMANRVSGPVQSLIQFMKRVGNGDLEARADLGGGQEFRQLSDALNRMIGELRDRLRLRHSLDVAMEVQQRLLPTRAPRIKGLDLAGHSVYCDETGGDYYDFLILDQSAPNNVLIAMGDVMGHGVAAALIMAGARAVLHDRADGVNSLGTLMGRLNRLLAADHEGTRFMTMYLSVIDAESRMLRWVSAGHDPAILYDPAQDTFEEKTEGDLPLGIMEETDYSEHEYGPLRPGQLVFVGTDGVWEMPNAAGEQFGKDRLKRILRESAARTAAEISLTLLDQLTAFKGESRSVDDVTFVIIKVV